MKYSVHQLAQMSGISVRTIHYYDEIGLLKPSIIAKNGYRYYTEKELLILQQILFYKELEFSLEEIKGIIHAPAFSIEKALRDHKMLLELKMERIKKLVKTIGQTLSNLKGGGEMTKKLFTSFDEKQLEQYKEEAKKRWGNTDAYKQSIARTKNWTKKDYERVAEEGSDITQGVAEKMDLGFQNEEVQKLIAKHHMYISQFYDVSFDMYKNLGKMYVEDARFTAYYEKFRKGLAQFMSDAITIYCSNNQKV